MPYATDIFISEFLHSPLGSIVAALTIVGLLYKIFNKMGDILFRYKKYHSVILKNAGIPAFVLNAFLISFSLRGLPSTGRLDKVSTFLFFILFIFSSWHFVPTFIKVLRAQPDTTLLIWTKTGKEFYASESKITDAEIFGSPQWSLSADDCVRNASGKKNEGGFLSDNKYYLCGLITSKEGKLYLKNSVAEFKKDRCYIYGIILTVEFISLWVFFCGVFHICCVKKVRRHILIEQKKAILCARGDFTPAGIYSIYQELECKTRS
ncbi:TPA: hypothetical protein I8Y21_003635 [Klebsiella oxytoca]|uniref:Uncharacterized protein n=1 Tax=Klebsiella oxytoca TaxID=571 RepID=A0AAN5RER7_KLEOX|nr:hypothetical protein [Klebsiella oxytoca]